MVYAIGYEVETQTLDVVFLSGGIYRYHNVPESVYQGLLAAESKGRFMWAKVIDVYPYERIRRQRPVARRSEGTATGPASLKQANSLEKGESR